MEDKDIADKAVETPGIPAKESEEKTDSDPIAETKAATDELNKENAEKASMLEAAEEMQKSTPGQKSEGSSIQSLISSTPNSGIGTSLTI